MPELLTPEERHTVILCLQPAAAAPERRLWYVAFVLPSLMFALYGLWHQDFVAMLVAYLALLIVALMYLGRNTTRSDHLRRALEKYEAKVGALREAGDG
jgi:membrane protein implicated in regulation of membrane protease activity